MAGDTSITSQLEKIDEEDFSNMILVTLVLALVLMLSARGLGGVELVVSDAHQGLRGAIAAVFGGASWQRCRTHFMTNLLTRVPRRAQPWVVTMVRTIYQQPSPDEVHAQLDRVTDQLQNLSVGAAYGVVVMVFQWGWGISLLGSESTGVVEPWRPLFLFAILFGLSMDYHMLVFNRIKEAHDQGHSNEESVSIGIKITAGQVTAAAAIMVGVFLTFALGRQVPTQQMGLGLGVAVLIDATLIRVILLPASMKLLGEANWYLPKWLDWLPRVGSEGEKESQVIGEIEPAGGGRLSSGSRRTGYRASIACDGGPVL